jgi:hypothetical protein
VSKFKDRKLEVKTNSSGTVAFTDRDEANKANDALFEELTKTPSPAPRVYKLEESGNQHNIGIKAVQINGNGGWDDLILPNHRPLEVIEHSAYLVLQKEHGALKSAKLSRDIYCDQIEKEMGRELRDTKADLERVTAERDHLSKIYDDVKLKSIELRSLAKRLRDTLGCDQADHNSLEDCELCELKSEADRILGAGGE